MIRTYPLDLFANSGKEDKIIEIIGVYRKTAESISKIQWDLFFRSGSFNKMNDLKVLDSRLSERYKQTCQYQVVGTLFSFISNRQRDFSRIVIRSTIPEPIRIQILFINKHRLWFNKEVRIPKFDDQGKRIEGEFDDINPEIIKLARKIFRGILAKHRRPSFRSINLALDAKVVKITLKEEGKAKEFEYWLKFSTLEKNKPIYLPLKTNEYFEAKSGILKNFVFVDLKEELKIFLVKEIEPREYEPETEKISLDTGLKTLFATDQGDLFGRGFYEILIKYDKAMVDLTRNLQARDLKFREDETYKSLVSKFRNFLKNEINRVFNRIIEIYKPAEIVVERLDFRKPELSSRMNRLLSNFGKSLIENKLESLQQEFKIKITKINPAYTSRECNRCHFVSKTNRKAQDKFNCQFCGYQAHADVNAARNISARSSDKEIGLYRSKSHVLQILVGRFLSSLERESSPYRRAIGLFIKDGLGNHLAKNGWT